MLIQACNMEELWKLEISGPTGIRNLSTLFCWAAVLFYFLIIVHPRQSLFDLNQSFQEVCFSVFGASGVNLFL